METKEKKKPVAKATATPEVKKDTWEYKDRTYYLKGSKEPLTFKVSSRHTPRHPMFWFDPEKGYNRELRYATNQKSVFVDEQQGPVTLEHIVFEDGTLFVPKEKVQLQKLLSIYHPAKEKVYNEFDKKAEAVDELDIIEFEIKALNAASVIDIEQAEAILRVENGSAVSNLSSKELKRDILIFAKRNPKLFLDLAQDENVVLRNFAINAKEANIIALSQDQRTFTWVSNGRKLMNVPFDENPYSAMAAWFQTDEGLEVYKSIDKKLK
jgi:hypothetical protein